MNKVKFLLFISFLITSFLFLSLSSAQAHASVLDDIVNGVKNTVQGGVDGVKNLFTKTEDNNVKNKEFTIDSDISLVPGGDENNNGQIDAGDMVRFTYTLKNTTESNYSFATLKTNIDSKQVSFIHNIHGATGIVNDGKTVEIPHVRLNLGETFFISFDALINSFQEDKTIATEAELISSDKKTVAKSLRKAIEAKKLNVDEIEKRGLSIRKK